jgi:hypothetical protein
MKAVRVIVLIAVIAIPSSSFAWSRGGGVIVRPGFSNRAVFVRSSFPGRVVFVQPAFPNRVVFVNGFPRRFVAPGFFGGVATGIVLNPAFFPRSFYFPGPYINYYPSGYAYYPDYYPPSYSYAVPPAPPPAVAPNDAYDRGYSEGYSQGYEEAQKERAKERYEEGKKRGYEEGYEAGKDVQNPWSPPSENSILVKEKVSVIPLQRFGPTKLPAAPNGGRLSNQERQRAFVFVGKKTTITEAGAAVRTIEFVGI